jgi:hypothetical protein
VTADDKLDVVSRTPIFGDVTREADDATWTRVRGRGRREGETRERERERQREREEVSVRGR